MAIDTRVIGRDPDAQLVTLMHYDEADDSMTIEHVQEVQPLIDLNQVRANEARSDWKGDLHFVGSIDAVTHMKLIAEGIMRDPKRLRRWLNDRDNQKFRVKLGRV